MPHVFLTQPRRILNIPTKQWSVKPALRGNTNRIQLVVYNFCIMVLTCLHSQTVLLCT